MHPPSAFIMILIEIEKPLASGENEAEAFQEENDLGERLPLITINLSRQKLKTC